jgi:predicted GH43/DUF377 family glycosyl hydrolase
MSVSSHIPFELHRVGPVMEPEPNNPAEAWGVLNPASARHNGELYLFPREVAEGNYSRIGIARVIFQDGTPTGVERLGHVLEPEEDYERSERSHGGVEDPRITYVEPLGRWVMAYVALSQLGPRLALAVSDDLFHWQRLGLLRYETTGGVDFNHYGNKDGMLFPDVVEDPNGNMCLAILHRPTYLVQGAEGTVALEIPSGVNDERESIWISYMSLDAAKNDIGTLINVYDNELVAVPEQPWEVLKIGGGTPPIRIPQGWLTFYHGVSGSYSLDPGVPKHVCYSAGAMVLDASRPTKIVYRSAEPVLVPEKHHEMHGIVPNVVFPTAIDARDEGRIDVYYGAADSQIAVATTTQPHELPASENTAGG